MNFCSQLKNIRSEIAEKGKIIVAYSGGVDSSLLAKIAHDVLGENALCIIIDSETLPRSELDYAVQLAQSLGLNYEVIRMHFLSAEEFVQNRTDRCYFCKKASFTALKILAAERGITCIADGMNCSDYDDYRPGIAACEEMGIWHPFVDAGISKEDIRELAQRMKLSFWNKPTSACLSSRIPYGERITIKNLEMVELAEDFLKCLGFGQLRVRAHGNLARIELLGNDLEKAMLNRIEISKKFRSFGFSYVTLDMNGFRTGSMNEVLLTQQMDENRTDINNNIIENGISRTQKSEG